MVTVEEIDENAQRATTSDARNDDPKPSCSEREEEKEEEEEEAVAATPTARAPTPAAPPAPQIKVSQILPLVAVIGMQKFDIEQLGYVRHAEAAFMVTQLACAVVLYMIYVKIQQMSDTGARLKIPEVKQLGQVISPACEQAPKEYDMGKLMEQVKQAGMSFVILGGIYMKWGSLYALVMQVILSPSQLYDSPLFQLHILAKDTKRPFPTPNLLGLPEMPQMPQEAEAVAAIKKDD